MTVVEAPTKEDWPPLAYGPQKYGHFVLFRFDYVASVAAFDDEEASRAAALLPQEWFLGIAMTTGTPTFYNAAGSPLLNLHIYFVGVGPADPISTCIPISPAPQLADDHPPIELPSSLPWPNLYVHSYYNVKSLITRIHYGSQYFSASLTEEQRAALFERTDMDDFARHRVKPGEKIPASAAMVAATKAMAAANKLSNTSDDAASLTESDHGRGSDDFLLSDEAQSIIARYERRTYPGELWLDPTAFSGLPADPAGCEEAFRRVSQLEDESFERMFEEAKTRRQQQMKAWIEGVTNASARSSKERVVEGDIGVPLDEDAVLPEDAVDSRIEAHDPEAERVQMLLDSADSPEMLARIKALFGVTDHLVDSPTVPSLSGPAKQSSPAPSHSSQRTTIASPKEIAPPTRAEQERLCDTAVETHALRPTTDAVQPHPVSFEPGKPVKKSILVRDWLVSVKRTAVASLFTRWFPKSKPAHREWP